MSNTYWRPFNMVDEAPILDIVKGEGVYLYDINGNKFQDAYSGLWNVNYGYSDIEIKNDIKKQIDELPYVNPITLGNSKVIELSNLLCELTHDEIEKIIYTCSGSESIEAAIKISRKYSSLIGKKQYYIAVISESYHGSYYGSMSASFYDSYEKEGYGPMLDGFINLPLPFTRRSKTEEMDEVSKAEILQKLENKLDEYKDKLCAIIVEPILASGGVIPLFEEYLYKLNNFCRNNDVLFICDEVATGFGRTGTMFRFQQFDIKPDIITMSKGINNGYLPFGTVCISRKIKEAFLRENSILFHLSTQNANPICIASALTTIKKMQRENAVKKINIISDYFKKIMLAELENLSMIFEIRIYGLMAAIDLIDIDTNKPIKKEKLISIIGKVYSMGCITGISFIKNITSSILIFPQYISTEENVENIVSIIKTVLTDIESRTD